MVIVCTDECLYYYFVACLKSCFSAEFRKCKQSGVNTRGKMFNSRLFAAPISGRMPIELLFKQ